MAAMLTARLALPRRACRAQRCHRQMIGLLLLDCDVERGASVAIFAADAEFFNTSRRWRRTQRQRRIISMILSISG